MSTPVDAVLLHRLADAADAETLPRFRSDLVVDTKVKPGETFDPVTEADRAAERAMRAILERELASHAIWGEEFGQTEGDGRHRWVLDPVDGTRPFLCGLPVWGTLIGLTVDGRAELGLMSQPVTRERFWADPAGAWTSRDGAVRSLRVNARPGLSDAILHTNSPHQLGDHRVGLERLAESCRMTRFGGECYAMAMLAAGRIDICFEPALQPYDIIALIPIVERAGGIITTLDGGRPEYGGAVLASASAQLHHAALDLLNR